MSIESTIINGKKIYAFKSREEFLDFIDNKNKILIALNAEKLNKTNEKLDAVINDNIGYADGVGAVFAVKTKGHKTVKIPGVEFWLDIIKKYKDSKSFYFIGANEEVIQSTINKLKQDFPGINIVGFRNGYLKEGDEKSLIKEFKEKKPDVIFVAMGSPKQEFLMSEFKQSHPALYMGLGGSYDVYSGLKKRAPKLFLNLGLEWLYRLLKEPTRFKRQINLFKFAFKVLLKKI